MVVSVFGLEGIGLGVFSVELGKESVCGLAEDGGSSKSRT
jgi:hypothetical protein